MILRAVLTLCLIVCSTTLGHANNSPAAPSLPGAAVAPQPPNPQPETKGLQPTMGDKAVPKAVTAPVGGTIVPKQTPTPWALEQKLNLQKADKIVVQTALAELGYYQSSIDGAIGPISRRAISAWQTANGQTAHGYLDINQYVALVDAANSGRAQAGRDLLPRTPIGPHRMLRGVASE